MVMNPEVQNFRSDVALTSSRRFHSFRLLGQLVDMLRKHDGDPFFGSM